MTSERSGEPEVIHYNLQSYLKEPEEVQKHEVGDLAPAQTEGTAAVNAVTGAEIK